MQSKGNAPNAAQKRWRESVRRIGCIACHQQNGIEIHHVAGSTAKFNKQAIGHLWILPLCHDCHVLMGEPDEFCRQKYGFTMVGRFDVEKLLFADLLTYFPEPPITEAEMQAIMEFRR